MTMYPTNLNTKPLGSSQYYSRVKPG